MSTTRGWYVAAPTTPLLCLLAWLFAHTTRHNTTRSHKQHSKVCGGGTHFLSLWHLPSLTSSTVMPTGGTPQAALFNDNEVGHPMFNHRLNSLCHPLTILWYARRHGADRLGGQREQGVPLGQDEWHPALDGRIEVQLSVLGGLQQGARAPSGWRSTPSLGPPLRCKT
jgi:hypothetical protein